MDAVAVFDVLAHRAQCVFLDSARRHPELGRFSFVAADPFEVIAGNDLSQLDALRGRLNQFATSTLPQLPPLQGGAIGLLGYDMAYNFEKLPRHAYDEFDMPRLWMGLYDVVFAFDHRAEQGWLVSQGFPETAPGKRQQRAKQRAEEFLSHLRREERFIALGDGKTPVLEKHQLAPQFETPHDGILSNFSRSQYLDTVARAVDYIHAGDIFQVNLSQRLMCPAREDSVSLYKRLRDCNPAPFAGYLDLGDQQIVSASPERFMKVQDQCVETRPIKGTRPRLARAEADLFSAAELAASSKDYSENVMIVDLMRNDLSRVCRDDSVHVVQLCQLESYEHVQHLVSVIQAELRPDMSNVDLITCSFPGGSISGAPKVRAMEIIAELEPTARGAYCGCLGYLGFDGSLDMNILIRTITASHGWWRFPVGGGIVAKSDPEAEYRETWSKAEGILQAVTGG